MSDAVSAQGLVPLMRDLGAEGALFLDVFDFALGADLAVPATDAAAGHRLEPEQSDQTHCPLASPPCNRHARQFAVNDVAIGVSVKAFEMLTAAAMDPANKLLDHLVAGVDGHRNSSGVELI